LNALSILKEWVKEQINEHKFIIRFRILNYRCYFGILKVTDTLGFNSKLDDGTHILMWDFDNIDLASVRNILRQVQYRYFLPTIYICKTSENSYYAFCLKRYDFKEAFRIVASTPKVDFNFLKYSLLREYFTLRIVEKEKKPAPILVEKLESKISEDVKIEEIKSYSLYETKARG